MGSWNDVALDLHFLNFNWITSLKAAFVMAPWIMST